MNYRSNVVINERLRDTNKDILKDLVHKTKDLKEFLQYKKTV